MTWHPLASVPPKAIEDARIQTHHAVQLVAAVGNALVPAREDASHKSFTWDTGHEAAIGLETGGARPFRMALRVADLTLLALGDEVETFPLLGQTLAEGLAWVGETARRHDPSAPDVPAHTYDHDFPDHPVGTGAAFDADPAHLAELARYFANSQALLEAVQGEHAHAGPLRMWPHHFDLATLLAMPGDGGRTVGVGFSPGDAVYAEPYWYVSPYPYPEADRVPRWEGRGEWHALPWFGAALRATDLADAEGDQEAIVSGFFGATIPVAIDLLSMSED